MNFSKQFNWQLKFADNVKVIIKSQLYNIVNIEIALPEDDLLHATDYQVKVNTGDIAVRIRRDTEFRDITVRAFNKGHKTEIDKIRAGYCDWYLYIWTRCEKIVEWIFLDVNILRSAGLFNNNRRIIMNKDNCTGFVFYSIAELEKINGAILAHYCEDENDKLD